MVYLSVSVSLNEQIKSSSEPIKMITLPRKTNHNGCFRCQDPPSTLECSAPLRRCQELKKYNKYCTK